MTETSDTMLGTMALKGRRPRLARPTTAGRPTIKRGTADQTNDEGNLSGTLTVSGFQFPG